MTPESRLACKGILPENSSTYILLMLPAYIKKNIANLKIHLCISKKTYVETFKLYGREIHKNMQRAQKRDMETHIRHMEWIEVDFLDISFVS